MRLDGTRLRSRRLQLGLTMRGLARDTGLSQTLVKRLEETGEVDSLTCGALQRLVDALSLDLVDMLERRVMSPRGDEEILERLGTILLGRRSGISTTALASLLAIDAAAVEGQLHALADELRPVGICVHRGSTGIRLVPVEQVSESHDDPRYIQVPTRSNLRLLHRALNGGLHTRDVATMKDGNAGLHRLMTADLVDIGRDGAVRPGGTAREVFQLETN